MLEPGEVPMVSGTADVCSGNTAMPEVMDADGIRRSLRRISHEIAESHHDLSRVLVAGIHTRGAILAKRIAAFLAELSSTAIPADSLDVSPYRDDRDGRSERVLAAVAARDVTDRTVILVDDVLYTGRTIRAALDAIADIGRPAAVRLAVLIDRGHRELPIRPDFVGKNIPTSQRERVAVRLHEVDDCEGVFLDAATVARTGVRHERL